MKAYCQRIVQSKPIVLYLLFTILSVYSSTTIGQDLIDGYLQDADKNPKLYFENKKNLALFQPFQLSTSKKAFTTHPVLGKVLEFDISKGAIQYLHSNQKVKILLEIPISKSQQVIFELEQVEIFTSDYKLSTSSPTIKTKRSRNLFYRGKIRGSLNSSVSLTVFQNSLRMLITDNQGTYQITTSGNSSNDYLFYNAKNFTKEEDYSCLADDIHHPFSNLSEGRINKIDKSSTTGSCIPLYVETDFSTFQFFNNDELAIENYVSALVNEVSTIYNEEGIAISLSQIHIVNNAADDYTANFNFANQVIEVFAENVKDNYQGRLAHFISHRNLLGGTGWIGVLCNSYDTFEADWDLDGTPETHHYGPYAVSSNIGEDLESFPTYSWDVNVFAHELGHNIGSPHTHKCAWGPDNLAIDNCQSTVGGCGLITSSTPPSELGTIMSYCHLTGVGIDLNKGFGTLPGALLRQNYQNASCTLSCDTDILGCTIDTFHNYNSAATINDGSCMETCEDNIKNGDETGIDCGGELCQPCSDLCTNNYIKFTIVFDNIPTETSWRLIDSTSGDTIDFGESYTDAFKNDTLYSEYCLNNGTYMLELFDDFGDGICCSEGNGSYSIEDDQGNTIVSGAQFGTNIHHYFQISQEVCTEMLNLNNTVLSGQYSSSQMIEANNSEVMHGSNVMLSSQVVNINEDFEIGLNSIFEIYNEGCTEE